ncbi:response regulator [Actinoplanes regularis]|uniref:response regulator n=1 Tax=Actinoplanes regularis TaxID=52697 RepID=UPI00249FD57D|nr:response regulator [Actinoplanes regularis]GLW30562.1 hypothetical protein Areg01_35020 [Actinoplanes regularis]
MQVLVVDDEADIRELMAHWLRADGHDVVVADGASSALAAVDEGVVPRAAVLDIDMPDVDGIELLHRLRERFPDLPALFVTVLWDADSLARAAATGGKHLRKPFTRTRFCTAVRNLLVVAGGDPEGRDR